MRKQTQREQQADERAVDETHQLDRTIVFPAEVSTPAAQVLRGRAATQTHDQTHGLSVLHLTLQTYIHSHIDHTQVAASAFLQSFCFSSNFSHFIFFFTPILFTLLSLSPFLSFPSSCLESLSVWRGCRWRGDWPGAAANPVLIETRVLIELSWSDRWRLAGRADCWSNSQTCTQTITNT